MKFLKPLCNISMIYMHRYYMNIKFQNSLLVLTNLIVDIDKRAWPIPYTIL